MAENQTGGDGVVWHKRVELAYLQHREAIVANLVGRHSMAVIEDALHEVLARWLARAPESAATAEIMLRPAYLFVSVRSQIEIFARFDRRRKHSTNRGLNCGGIIPVGETPKGSDPAHAEEPVLSETQLSEELARLPDSQLEALRTFAAENVRSRTASRTLGCGEGALFVRRFRAIESIRLHREECEAIERIGLRRKDSSARARRGVTVCAAQLGIAS